MITIKRYFWYGIFIVAGVINSLMMQLVLKSMNRLNNLTTKAIERKNK